MIVSVKIKSLTMPWVYMNFARNQEFQNQNKYTEIHYAVGHEMCENKNDCVIGEMFLLNEEKVRKGRN